MKLFLIYFVLAFFYFFPNPVTITTHIIGIAEWPEDSLGVLASFWQYQDVFNLSSIQYSNPFIGAPFGVNNISGVASIVPIYSGFIYLLTSFCSDVVAYNLFIILGISLSATSMAFFVRRMIGSRLAGMFSGLIFGFSPNIICHALAGHIGFTHAYWIPIFVLSFGSLLRKPSLSNIIISAFLFACVWLSSSYFGYFTFLFALVFVLWRFLIFERGLKNILKKLFVLTNFGLLSFCILFPFLHKVVFNIIGFESGIDTVHDLFNRPFQDLFVYAARFWDYFLPSELNPIFGGISNKVQHALGGRHLFERNLYLGLLPLIFIVVFLKNWIIGKLNDLERETKFIYSALIVCAVLMVVLSFPPLINFGVFKIPMPSYFLYDFFPMFRVYARSGFMVSLCLAPIAAFGFKLMLNSMSSNIKKWLFTIFCILFLCLEYTLVPPVRNVNVSIVPNAYQWIANQKDDFIVAEYPFFKSIDTRHYERLSYQRIHRKRLLNGSREGTPEYWLLNDNRNLWDPDSPKKLSTLGIQYVLLHKEYYRKNKLQLIKQVEGMDSVYEDESNIIYEITAPPFNHIFVVGNTYPSEEINKKQMQWLAGDGIFVIFNRLDEGFFSVEFDAISIHEHNLLEIKINNKNISEWNLTNQNTQKIIIPSVRINKGLNSIELRSEQEPVLVKKGRKVSIAISDFHLSPL